MSKKRDDFVDKTKRILQERANNCCSNPDCRLRTSFPHSNENKVARIGDAAHITAATEGGPRYNNQLTNEERKHIANGIWLCKNCARLIDRDENKYTVELLQEWKSQAEKLYQMESKKSALTQKKSESECNLSKTNNQIFNGSIIGGQFAGRDIIINK